ncbi:hypothetical protein EON83_11185 [bacterium]|nr:MAG: hypothetical protein EON83_11185 [bacterium]
MFELDGLPDAIVHAQFLFLSTAPMQFGARALLVVDTSALKYSERPDVAARFAVVLAATVEPVAGLAVTWLAHRPRWNTFTPAPDATLKARFNDQRFLYFQLENISGGVLSLPDAGTAVTIVGIPPSPRPAGVAAVAAPTLPAQEGIVGEIQARSMGGVTLAQNWFDIVSSSAS